MLRHESRTDQRGAVLASRSERGKAGPQRSAAGREGACSGQANWPSARRRAVRAIEMVARRVSGRHRRYKGEGLSGVSEVSDFAAAPRPGLKDARVESREADRTSSVIVPPASPEGFVPQNCCSSAPRPRTGNIAVEESVDCPAGEVSAGYAPYIWTFPNMQRKQAAQEQAPPSPQKYATKLSGSAASCAPLVTS